MDQDLLEVGVPRLQSDYAQHRYTVTQVVHWHLQRIHRYDGVYRSVERLMESEARDDDAREDAEAARGAGARCGRAYPPRGRRDRGPRGALRGAALRQNREPLQHLPLRARRNRSIPERTSDLPDITPPPSMKRRWARRSAPVLLCQEHNNMRFGDVGGFEGALL